jgi:very-short-patch-repair endonuclease
VKPKGRRIRTPATIQERARELRQQLTAAEELLWSRLRNRQLDGPKFWRQHPLGSFIADFCCPSRRLIVQIDGDIRNLQADRDRARTEQFERHGYQVIRLRNVQVVNDIEDVLEAIEAACP